jgi:hypothetical protein
MSKKPSDESIKKLVRQLEVIEGNSAIDRKSVGYYARILLLSTIPHSNPGDVDIFSRTNGRDYLGIQSGVNLATGKPYGIPYGVIPRLLFAFISTEVVKKNSSPTIHLGSSLKEFMDKLNKSSTGGKTGSIKNLKDQMNRLFNSRIMYQKFESKKYPDMVTAAKNFQLVDEMEQSNWSDNVYFLWRKGKENQEILFESTITLSDSFYKEIKNRPIPFDLDILQGIRKSPLAIDLYLWSTYTAFYLKRKTSISWESLYRQFGAEYSQVKDFAVTCKKQMEKISFLYPDLKFNYEYGKLNLYPSKPSIPPKKSIKE